LVLGSRLTVVIPAHNDLATLPEAVASVRRQSQPVAACVVVSDSSDDGTGAWLAGQPDLTWRQVDLRSPAGARNAGLSLVTTPYVAFLDADDVWHPDRVALASRQVAARPDGVVWACGWRREGRPLDALAAGPMAMRRVDRHALLSLNRFQTSCVVARRGALAAAGGFDPGRDGAEDWDLWLRLAAMGTIWLTDVRMVTYRSGRERVSHDALRVYRQGLAMLEGQGADAVTLAWHHRRFAYALRRRGLGTEAAGARAAARAMGAVPAGVAEARLAAFLVRRGVRRLSDARTGQAPDGLPDRPRSGP